MKYIFTLFAYFLSWNSSYSQTLADSLLADFYKASISNHYKEKLEQISADSIEGNVKFILKQDDPPKNAPTNFEGFTVEYVSEEKLIKLLSKSSRDFKSYDFITVKTISPDTVDINIGGPSIVIKKGLKIKNGRLITREIRYLASCGGTMGYIPTSRFIYDSKEKSWKHFTYNQILESKREERRIMIESWKQN